MPPSRSRLPAWPPSRCASTLHETPVTVHLDQAKLLKLPERTATLVVGNPLIADAAVQPGGIVVITAKSYGMTNLWRSTATARRLVEYPIQVVGPTDKRRRGLSRHRAGDL